MTLSPDPIDAGHGPPCSCPGEADHALANLVPALLWQSDPAGNVIACNERWLHYTGCEPAQMQGTGWLHAIHPDDRAGTLAALEAALHTGEPVELRHRVRRADGAFRWYYVRQIPLRDRAAQIVRWYGAAFDVHEQHMAEQALRDSERGFRRLAEGVPQLVWRAARPGEWSWASPQWTAYTGLSDADSRGQGWLLALHPGDRESSLRAWESAAANGLYQVDHRIRHAGSGVDHWFQTRAVPVPDGQGGIAEWLGTSTDIDDQMTARAALTRKQEELAARMTERTAELEDAVATLRQASCEREDVEDRLRQSEKLNAIGQLTGGIAHDFNNMLQGVVAGLEMARSRVAAGRTAEVGRYLDIATEAVNRAAGLTRRLLAFARRQRLEPRAVDPDTLIGELADMIRRTVGPGIEVVPCLRDGAGSVLCDPTELENAVLNLCINARDAMPEAAGRLTLGTRDITLSAADIADEDAKPGRYVEVSVGDNGTGMAPDVLAHAFEPFFTTKPLGQGTGLGLSQIYGFVRQSGGLVRIESAPGRGTTVRLLLPFFEERAAASPAPDAPAPRAGSRRTLLLVDDEAAPRQLLAERLRELDYTVVEAGDGASALRLLPIARPDLLLTDVGLPGGLNGRQLAEAVRDRCPGLPVLFITGYAGVPLPPGLELIGKPFQFDALARRLRLLLDDAAAGGAPARLP